MESRLIFKIDSQKKTVHKPNFFLVGWPKTGSTSLHYYLSQHPEIFMSLVKESYYFCTDLIRQSDEIGAGKNYKYRTEEDYFKIFQGYTQEKILGESSVFYIISEEAIKNIKQYAPDSKILVILREPIELISSWHFYLNFHSRENVDNLSDALNLQEERKRLKTLPDNTHTPIHLQYDTLIDFPTHLKRLYNNFDKKNIKIIIYDDFKGNKETTIHEIFEFLNVEPNFSPDYTPKNVSKQIKNKNLKLFFDKRKKGVSRVLQKIGVLKTDSFLHRIYKKMFSTSSKRESITEEEKIELKKKYYTIVKDTSDLTGIDLLTKWNY